MTDTTTSGPAPTTGPQTPVLAAGDWKNNAELIADTARLGYLHDDWPTLDATYGLGRFWTTWRPDTLTTNDIDPTTTAEHHDDYRRLPFADDTFAAVVFDPPYQLNGTSTGVGPSAKDASYGVDRYSSVESRHQNIRDGITECLRVLARGARADRTTGGFLLVKCADQVNAGRVRWQTHEFTAHALTHPGVRLVDALHLRGYRAQPAGRSQQHARRNYSTLLVLRKERP